MKSWLVAAACAACLSALPVSQTENIQISVTPKPGQLIHYTVTDEFSIDGTSEGGSAENQPPKPNVTLAGKSVHVYTMLAGGPNEQGHITSQV